MKKVIPILSLILLNTNIVLGQNNHSFIESLLENPQSLSQKLSILKEKPSYLDSLNIGLENFFKQGNLEVSNQLFKLVDSTIKYEVQASLAKGKFYQITASNHAALRDFQKAYKLSEYSAEIYNSLDSLPLQEYVATERYRIEYKALINPEFEFEYEFNNLVTKVINEAGESSPLLIDVYSHIGTVFGKKNRFYKAKEYLLKSDKVYNLQRDTSQIAKYQTIGMGLGNVYGSLAQFEKALPYFLKSYNMLKNDSWQREAYLLNNLGQCYNGIGNSEKARSYYQKGLELIKGKLPPNHFLVLRGYQGLARTYRYDKEYQKSIDLHLTNIKALQAKPKENAYELAQENNFIAMSYYDMGMFDKALPYLHKSLTISATLEREDKLRIQPQSLLDLHGIKLKRNDPDAINPLNELLTLLTGTSTLDLQSVINLDEYSESLVLADCIITIGHYYLSKGEINKADLIFENMLTAFKQIRPQLDEGDWARWKGVNFSLYEGSLLAKIQSKHLDPTLVNQQIINILEFAKTDELLLDIRRGAIEELAEIPSNLIADERDLKTRIDLIKNNAPTEVDPKIADQLSKLESKYADLRKYIAEKSPRYNELKYEYGLTNFTTINDYLSQQNAAALIGFLGDKNLIYFLINNGTIDHHIIHLDTVEVLDKMDSGVDPYALLPNNEQAKTALKIPQILIDKMANVEQLIVCPDNQFNYLPIETIFASDLSKAPNISYAPSLSFLVNQKQTGNNVAVNLFAPTYDKSATFDEAPMYASLVREGLLELPGAQDEVLEIKEIIGGTVLNKNTCSKSSFLDNAPNSKVLHLAMHSVMNENSPLFSSLNFGSDEREILPLHEIYNINIPAELVVLSACNTGVGQVRKGKSIKSIASAFNYAGAQSVIMSLWKVPDASTKYIMVEFYKNLKAGMRKDKALKMAKYTYLNDESIPSSAKSPKHWAGFIATGNMDAVQFANKFSSKWMGLGIISLVLMLYLLMRRAKSSSDNRKN